MEAFLTGLTMKVALIVATVVAGVLSILCGLSIQERELKRWPGLRWVERNRLLIGLAAIATSVICGFLAFAEARRESRTLETTHDRGEKLAIRATVELLQQEIEESASRRSSAAIELFRNGDERMRASQFRTAAAAYQQSAAYVPTKAAFANLALCSRYISNHKMALEAARRAVALREEPSDGGRRAHANALLQLGITLSDLGQRDEARTHLIDSRARFQECREAAAVGAAEYALAINEFRRGRTTDALRLLSSASTRFLQNHDTAGRASSLNAIGVIRLEAGTTDAGLNALQLAAASFHQVGDIVGEAGTTLNIGSAREDLCELDAALKAYERCAAVAQRIGDKFLFSLASSSSASVLLEQGSITAARQQAATARQTAEGTTTTEDDGWVHLVLARAFRREGCIDSATAEISVAQRMFTRISVAGHLAALIEKARIAMAAKQFSKSEQILDEAIKVIDIAGYELHRPTVLAVRAELLAAQGDQPKATDTLKAAQQFNESHRIRNCMAGTIDSWLRSSTLVR
jgi:tetratricopeptide (TPR) repeat protein